MSCGKLAPVDPTSDDAGFSEMTFMSVWDMWRKMENSDCMCGSLWKSRWKVAGPPAERGARGTGLAENYPERCKRKAFGQRSALLFPSAQKRPSSEVEELHPVTRENGILRRA